MYQITPYTRQKAEQIGVKVKPSTNPKKKIDVFKGGEKIASIGASGYMDYPTYIQKEGKEVANERRRLYHKRHEGDRRKKWSKGWLASTLLW